MAFLLAGLHPAAAQDRALTATADGIAQIVYNMQVLAQYSLRGSGDVPVDVSDNALSWNVAPRGWAGRDGWRSPLRTPLRIGLSVDAIAVELTELPRRTCAALVRDGAAALVPVALSAIAVDATPEAATPEEEEDAAGEAAEDVAFAEMPADADADAAAKACTARARLTFFFPLHPGK